MVPVNWGAVIPDGFHKKDRFKYKRRLNESWAPDGPSGAVVDNGSRFRDNRFRQLGGPGKTQKGPGGFLNFRVNPVAPCAQDGQGLA